MDRETGQAFEGLHKRLNEGFREISNVGKEVAALGTKVDALQEKMPENKIVDTEECHERMSQCRAQHEAADTARRKPWKMLVFSFLLVVGTLLLTAGFNRYFNGTRAEQTAPIGRRVNP